MDGIFELQGEATLSVSFLPPFSEVELFKERMCSSGLGYSKLTTLLVNLSLKFKT